jgi:hypothetical protein
MLPMNRRMMDLEYTEEDIKCFPKEAKDETKASVGHVGDISSTKIICFHALTFQLTGGFCLF